MMFPDEALQGVRAHIFVVADMAYRALMSEGRSQSVVISGESGAGKTKSAREILRYIVEVASGAYNVGGHALAEADVIVRKITMNNPILEVCLIRFDLIRSARASLFALLPPPGLSRKETISQHFLVLC